MAAVFIYLFILAFILIFFFSANLANNQSLQLKGWGWRGGKNEIKTT